MEATWSEGMFKYVERQVPRQVPRQVKSVGGELDMKLATDTDISNNQIIE
jgi:hypothetical protein